MKLETTLSKLEESLETLVEGHAARLLTPGEQAAGVEQQAQAETAGAPHPMGETAAMPLAGEQPTERRAYLIINGERLFPLDAAVVNIGRLPDNDLVLNDPRVSRRHAQLRTLGKRVMIFDLDSTGGTFVNGMRVTQRSLHSGDVISLAGVTLIFGQEAPNELERTQEIRPTDAPTP